MGLFGNKRPSEGPIDRVLAALNMQGQDPAMVAETLVETSIEMMRQPGKERAVMAFAVSARTIYRELSKSDPSHFGDAYSDSLMLLAAAQFNVGEGLEAYAAIVELLERRTSDRNLREASKILLALASQEKDPELADAARIAAAKMGAR